MRDQTRTRKVLLTAWEAARDAVLHAENRQEYLLRSGSLLALSNVLNTLRHNGDGTDPIMAGEWEKNAMEIIAEWNVRNILPEMKQ